MSKQTRKTKSEDGLGEARQMRFQASVETELEQIAAKEGTDFPTVARMALRRGLEQLKKDLGIAA